MIQDSPAEARVSLALGVRAMVLGPLFLTSHPSESSSANATEVANTLSNWEGPGLVVVAGDLVDLLSDASEDPGPALRAHPGLAKALAEFSATEGCRLIWLPGLRDARLAWDEAASGVARAITGAEIACAAEIAMETPHGPKKVRVEPGHRFDPRSAGCAQPHETPLAHHVLTEILPRVGAARTTWLAGLDRIPQSSGMGRFVLSRLLYRRVAPYAWWLVLPLVAELVLKLPLAYLIPVVGRRAHASVWPLRFAVASITTLVDLVLVLAAVAVITRRTWAAISGPDSGWTIGDANDQARSAARDLVTAGHTGLITAHTLSAELVGIGPGFYANCGATAETVEERRARLGLPSVFRARREVCWVELEAGGEVHVRLLRGTWPVGAGSVAERIVASSIQERTPAGVSVVASYPHGPWWPKGTPRVIRDRRVRRLSAASIAGVGLLDLLSALTPPLRAHLDALFDVVPLAVTQAAAALVALAGVGLLALAGGIRRGQRQAWFIGVALLGGTAVLQVIKRGDVVETVIALVVMLYLLRHQRSFSARVDRVTMVRGLAGVGAGAAVATALAVVGVEIDFGVVRLRHVPHQRLPGLGGVTIGVVERLVGIDNVALPHPIERFLDPSLAALGVGLAAWALYFAFRPVVDRRTGPPDNRHRAMEIVARHGAGTLDYFALRDDKRHFFFGSTVVAYANWGGVCLVSPDPIGPEAEREAAWAAFRRMADAQGLVVGVLGAGEDWLAIYRASGMTDLYVGDEAVVMVDGFSLEGGRNKALRQAVNRVARNGYTLSFHDPAHIDPGLAGQLRSLMSDSRKGEAERGFSMTLGRIFDPADRGLLLAVAHDPAGTPVAFCQYVPAAAIDGYSLDLMRRDMGEHPNGLMDFVIVGTIKHLKENGRKGLGLNFATMRAVLAGEAGDNLPQRVERWLLRRMSGSMQIESLWRFNAKYDPIWQPRYAVFDAPEHGLAIAMAIARAESFWELPFIGRFLAAPDASGTVAEAPTTPT